MYVFFFFSSRRRHTRLQGDWSSDVCSSDLGRSTCSRSSSSGSKRSKSASCTSRFTRVRIFMHDACPPPWPLDRARDHLKCVAYSTARYSLNSSASRISSSAFRPRVRGPKYLSFPQLDHAPGMLKSDEREGRRERL